mgnify:CR=1 FL=1
MINKLNDNEMRLLLKKINVMVMIGVSASPLRASFFVARYFVLRGISVIPVNPNYEGQYLWGEKVLGKISDIQPDKRVDLIDIFRPSNEVPCIVDDTICYLKPLGCKTIWMQIGIKNMIWGNPSMMLVEMESGTLIPYQKYIPSLL